MAAAILGAAAYQAQLKLRYLNDEARRESELEEQLADALLTPELRRIKKLNRVLIGWTAVQPKLREHCFCCVKVSENYLPIAVSVYVHPGSFFPKGIKARLIARIHPDRETKLLEIFAEQLTDILPSSFIIKEQENEIILATEYRSPLRGASEPMLTGNAKSVKLLAI